MENNYRQLLIVSEGPGQGQTYVLQDMVCTLGRTPDNTIVIDSPRISRHHAQIRLLPEGAVIEDMGSTNGTWVNGRRLTSPHRLSHGDTIGLADYITFRFETEATVRTEKLSSAPVDSATQVMHDVPTYPDVTPPPIYQEAYPQVQAPPEAPSYVAAQPPLLEAQAPPKPKRSKGIYIIVALLLIAICVCLAVGIYLWFAPTEFWEQVFQFFNIPLPQ